MRLSVSRDTIIVIIVLVIVCIGAYYIAATTGETPDSLSSYSNGKKGLKAFYMLLDDLGFNIGRYSKPLNDLPKRARVLFMVGPPSLDPPEEKALSAWVKKGNTLILILTSWWNIPESLNISVYPTLDESRQDSGEPTVSRYSDGVKRVWLSRSGLSLDSTPQTPIVKIKTQVMAAETKVGKGRIIAVGDSALFSNSNIRYADNVVLATNFVYKNAGREDLVLFYEYKPKLDDDNSTVIILDKYGYLALIEISIAAVLLILSLGKRFGAVHPLIETVEKRRGWELVKAMAGLYKRAGASSAALISVYQSFRRELFMAFGVSPTAGPGEAADTILRARPVDKARLSSLLYRCDRITAGVVENVSENEAVLLVKIIEKLRRELGIARSINNTE